MTTEQIPLYNRVGGETAIRRLVGEFYRRVLSDEILAPFFEHTPMEKLEDMQIEFFSAALGGPVRYTGLPLAEAHAGRGIGRKHLQRFLDHLFEALETLDEELTKQDRREVIARINTYVGEITGEVSVDG